MGRRIALLFAALALTLPLVPADAQECRDDAEIRKLRAELETARARVRELKAEIQRQEKLPSPDLRPDRLRELLEWLRRGDLKKRAAAIREITAAPNLGEIARDPAVTAVAEVHVLLRDDFSERSRRWTEKHGGGGLMALEWADGQVRWERTGGDGRGGAVSIVRALTDEVSRSTHLLLGARLKVGSHSLGNSGWHSQSHGGPGEYPAHVQVDWLDDTEKRGRWSHGFLTRHDGGTRFRNYTLVPRGEWCFLAFDLLDPATRESRDPERPGLAVKRPMLLRSLTLMGNGWDFSGAVDEIQLVSIRFP